jgi:RNA-binding protein YhbY
LDKLNLGKSRKWNLEKIESRKVEKVGNNGILESRISEILRNLDNSWTLKVEKVESVCN